MSDSKEVVIYEDPKDNWSAQKLVVLCIVTLIVAFGILDIISDIGLRMAGRS